MQTNNPTKRIRRQRARAVLFTTILALSSVGGHSLEKQTRSDNATLSKLQTTANSKVLAAAFPDPADYEMLVPSTRETVEIAATTADPKATLTINGMPAQSGVTCMPLPLEYGMNRFDILVTAEDGQTQRHHLLKVIRGYPTPNWVRKLEHAPFVPRDSSGELTFKGRMWIFGGYIPELISDVWASSDGVNWEHVGDIPDDSGINVPFTAVFDDKMWITSNGGSLYCSDDGKAWTKVLDKVPFGQGVGAVHRDRMWVVGGVGGREVWSSANGKDWRLEQGAAPWSIRSNFGNVLAYGGKLWVFGGSYGRYQPFKAYGDVWASEDGINWTQVTDRAPWPPRRWTCSAVYRNRMWMIGGFRAQPEWTNLNDVWYSSDGKDWKQLITQDIWSERHEISPYVHDNKLWIVAGNAWPLVNDVWQLDIAGLVFLTQPPLEEYVGARYEYRPLADFNESAKPVSYRLIESPKWLNIDNAGVISGVPSEAGEYPVVVEAYDSAGETARQSYSIHVITP
jgi:hypothetical protein